MSFARPVSAEAQKVREVLLPKGLETPLIENGLSREQKFHTIREAFTEIAEALGKSDAAVRVMLTRTMKQLHELLAED